MKNGQQPTSNNQYPMPVDLRVHWMFGVGRWLLAVPKSVLIFAIRAYQLTISPALTLLFGGTGGCRFTPTCSQFAMDAIRAHGVLAGGALAARRICRCHPWGGCGQDPAPANKNGARGSESGI
jgi:putative membrane protein insertion efficiency factor